jgi:VIT1/CCC1 family predicted Fe2+/Mn2+ transporter
MASPTTHPPSGEFPDMSQHPDEPHSTSIGGRMNALRAGVLGANDGIVSTAGLVMGVAGATTDRSAILVAGVAGLVAGAISMAAGEYVSVSTQRDTERSLIAKETRELAEEPEDELAELAGLYRQKGLSEATARQVAVELTEHDALRSHLDIELGIDPDELTNPWHAALASMLAFTLGALLPLLTIVLSSADTRVFVTLVTVCLALAGTGFTSARIGGSRARPAVLRVVVGGLLAMAVTYAIGTAVGVGLA